MDQASTCVPGFKNVSAISLVDPNKIFLPPLHIKLGLMKNVVKALNKFSGGYKHLHMLFPKIGVAKLNKWIFVCPDLRKFINLYHQNKIENKINFFMWNNLIKERCKQKLSEWFFNKILMLLIFSNFKDFTEDLFYIVVKIYNANDLSQLSIIYN